MSRAPQRSASPYVYARSACALILGATAANHALLAFAGAEGEGRHAVFVGVNLSLGALLVLRPKWALLAAIALGVQQLGSHGTDFVRSVRAAGPVDWLSLGVVIFFALLVTLLVAERRTAHTRARLPAAPPRS